MRVTIPYPKPAKINSDTRCDLQKVNGRLSTEYPRDTLRAEANGASKVSRQDGRTMGYVIHNSEVKPIKESASGRYSSLDNQELMYVTATLRARSDRLSKTIKKLEDERYETDHLLAILKQVRINNSYLPS
jgi:hypothetical protein